MGLFKKKPDPLGERARDLSAELAALEAEIKKLSSQRAQIESHPRLRSTATPGQLHSPSGRPVHSPPPAPAEPIFEEVNQEHVKTATEPAAPPTHFNDLGGRKYDLAAAWRRWGAHFRAPVATNPKLINYLAAGSIQGLRPLRYEKRVARNRCILMCVVLLFVLWGLFAYFLRNR